MDYNHPAVGEYISASKVTGSFLKENIIEPAEVHERFNQALAHLRIYLDSINIKMPLPKYPYDPREKNTWRFSEVKIINDKKRKRKYVKEELNPTWIYARKK